jgi:hypothetical protein
VDRRAAAKQISPGALCMFSAFRQAKHTVPACPTKPWRSRKGRLDNRPALQLQRRLLTIPNRPRPAGSGWPLGLKMIRITSLAEEKRPGFAVFRVKQKLTPLHPGPPGRGIAFFVLRTGAEAPAYYQSASPDFAKALSGRPRRRRYPPCVRVPVLSVLRAKHVRATPQNLVTSESLIQRNQIC